MIAAVMTWLLAFGFPERRMLEEVGFSVCSSLLGWEGVSIPGAYSQVLLAMCPAACAWGVTLDRSGTGSLRLNPAAVKGRGISHDPVLL